MRVFAVVLTAFIAVFSAAPAKALADIQEVVKAAAQHSSVILPPTTAALPEEQAWSMIYAEGGAMALLLAIGVMVLWRLVSRILNETRAQNEQLMKSQVEAINRLGETMVRVQAAVRESDLNNTHAIGKLTDTAPRASASGRPCDDELTLLAETMKPAHRKFCDLYLSGVMGTQATLGAGYQDRKTGWALLRRADVRRYIQLMQREVSVASRVSLNTLVDRLWRMATDPTIAQKRQDTAMLQLVRIFTAGNLISKPNGEAPKEGAGLSDELIGQLEAQLLGIRQAPVGPEA